MSGGSMNYFYLKVEEAAAGFALTTLERIALSSHMVKLARALKAIEWNDSGDGDDDEDKLIRDCLAPREVLLTSITKAEEMVQRLQKQIELAKKEQP